MPRHEQVACARWSEDGKRVAAASERGSLALWSSDGRLLADWPGSTPLSEPCYEDQFVLAPKGERVVATLGRHTAQVFGPGLQTTISGSDPKTTVQSKFSLDGRRLFVVVDSERLLVYDALAGRLIKQLPGSSLPELSPSGRYFSLPGDEEHGETEPYSTESLEPYRGRRDLDIAHLQDAFGRDAFAAAGPWRVGGAEGGYGVFDIGTSQQLASWEASGYGCGYSWRWQGSTLIFIEGPLLTFWTAEGGAETHASDCLGAQRPMLSRDGSRVLALDAVWDVATRKPIARLEGNRNAEVWGFSRDEQRVLGTITLDSSDTPVMVGWDTSSGRASWLKQVTAVPHEHARLFVDDRSGKPYWMSVVVDPTHGVVPLIFDESCWTGPGALPHRKELLLDVPARRCPGLLVELRQVMQAHGFAAPVFN